MKSGWQRRLLRGLVLYVLTPYLAVAAIFVLFQRKLLFQPTKTGRLLAAEQSAADAEILDIELATDDGPVLHGWHFRPLHAADDGERFLVIYFPGNGGCRAHRLADCRDFTRLGCDALIFDYPGYGDNDGSPSEERIIADAHRIWKFATEKLASSPNRIMIFGESLGGAVTVRLVSELSAQGTSPAAIVLNSTFDTLANVVAWHYPAFPFRFLLWDRFDSAGSVTKITCPILQFHGTADEIVPIQHGQRLFAAAKPGDDRRFITIEGGTHNFITVDMMEREIAALLERIRSTSE